jgi:hypothetical protein
MGLGRPPPVASAGLPASAYYTTTLNLRETPRSRLRLASQIDARAENPARISVNLRETAGAVAGFDSRRLHPVTLDYSIAFSNHQNELPDPGP